MSAYRDFKRRQSRREWARVLPGFLALALALALFLPLCFAWSAFMVQQ